MIILSHKANDHIQTHKNKNHHMGDIPDIITDPKNKHNPKDNTSYQ